MTATRLLALDIADDATAWARAGFTVADGAVHLGGVVLRLQGPGSRTGATGWALASDDDHPMPPPADVDGLTVSPPPGADAALLPPSATRHANGAQVIDHLVIATPDMDQTTAAFTDRGWQPRRTMAAPRGPQGRVLRFFLVPAGDGRVVLEVLHDPVDGPATTTIWGLAVVVADLDVARRRIGPDVIGEPADAVQTGRRIATVRGSAIGISLPLALMSPRP